MYLTRDEGCKKQPHHLARTIVPFQFARDSHIPATGDSAILLAVLEPRPNGRQRQNEV